MLFERGVQGVKDTLIGMVQFMFEKRAHTWDEWLKGGVMCPLFN